MIKKKCVILSIEYFLSIFAHGLIFESPEEVISSGEVSKGNTELSVLNECSAETGNTF